MPPEPNSNTPDAPAPHTWLLRRADQATLAVAVVLCLAAMAGYWLYHGGPAGRVVDIERAEPLQADFQIDVNSAYWFEFAQIPNIGETLGRRIVDERERNGPFFDHQELQQRVSGIGPKTLETMRPYLLPMPPAGTIVDGPHAEVPNG